MDKAIVAYDRSKRQYRVVHDDRIVATFPAGAENGEAARREALRRNDPAVHATCLHLTSAVFADYPHVHDRTWNAGRMVADSNVLEPWSTENSAMVARVRNQYKTGPQRRLQYAIERYNDGTLSCSCHDYRENPSVPSIKGQRLCKHIIAYKIHLLLKRPLNPNPENPPPSAELPPWTFQPATTTEAVPAAVDQS